MKYKKIETYFELYVRDDAFIVQFREDDKYLPDLLHFTGVNCLPSELKKEFACNIISCIGDQQFVMNGWLNWGSNTTYASVSVWKHRDLIQSIILKILNSERSSRDAFKYKSKFDQVVNWAKMLAPNPRNHIKILD